MMRFNVIVAHSFPKYGIGLNGELPWNIKKDMAHFKNITTKVIPDPNIHYINAVIMGRKTWESIPQQYRPLSDRLNVVITRQKMNSENPLVRFCEWNQLESVLMGFNTDKISDDFGQIYQISYNYIIGGESIYRMAMNELDIDNVYITEVYKKGEYDTFFPDINKKNEAGFIVPMLKLVKCSEFEKENGVYFRFMTYKNEKNILEIPIDTIYKNTEEEQYLALMKNILENGIERGDRTGTGTISLFGQQMKFNLRDTFPLSTTKRMFFRAIFEELMLYLRGQTDNKILVDKNIHIWDGNTSRDFLDKRGLTHYQEGDMGETYGFNFRHFGGKYRGCQYNYDFDNGFDQLSEVIRLIREEPESRRIIINLWNPDGNQRAALPSCLCMYQFYVDTIRRELHLQIYIRSSDYFLANNWNTCTGALLVHMLCNLEGINLNPGDLTVVTGDTHLYKSHTEQVRENINREPYPFPKLVIREQKKEITEFVFEDLELLGYKAHPRISAPMAV